MVENTKFSREIWQKNLTPLFNLWKGLDKIVAQNNIKDIS
jgi:hypothetical protein